MHQLLFVGRNHPSPKIHIRQGGYWREILEPDGQRRLTGEGKMSRAGRGV